ncbi:hypothetical protein BTN50_1852 [Candidatus Enterovibrio altilux]|uniref:Uncharacterized protein n=1 Tax=Candidatus Enterovibrio altilux TaxID=1927128 RepID=A0A291BB92_9GAMM|nr:hypothetical protein BTN50_1852 [Candidatus Enterovibrio luxaltus]
MEVTFLLGTCGILHKFLKVSRINYNVFVRLLLYQPNTVNISHND